jgi:Co/Zn/Cd efflux system component
MNSLPDTQDLDVSEYADSYFDPAVHTDGLDGAQQHHDCSHEEERRAQPNRFMPARQLGLAVMCCLFYLVSMLVGGIVANSLGAPPCPSVPFVQLLRAATAALLAHSSKVDVCELIRSHSRALLGESAHGLADLGILSLNFIAAVRLTTAGP